MDYFREILNMGGNIMDTVNDAINSNDYSGLARNIRDQVTEFTKAAVEDGRRTVYTRTTYSGGGRRTTYTVGGRNYYSGGQRAYRGGFWPQDIDLGTRPDSQVYHSANSQNRPEYNQNAQSQAGKFTGQATGAGYNAGEAYDARRRAQNASWNYSSSQNSGQGGVYQGTSTTAITPFNQYRPKASSAAFTEFTGILGLLITVPATVTLIAASTVVGGGILGPAIMGFGAGASAYLTSKGARQRKLSKTFDNYSRILGPAEYSTIEDIAKKSGETEEIVSQNLDKMISAGMLPQAKFDTGKTTLMLTKEAYDQYLLAEDARKDRERQEAELDEKMGSSEARKVITEGEEFVTKIKAANDLIPGEEMSEKLNQMERIVSKIFAQVRKDPSSAEDLRKFMNYYLPTTEKLLNAYIDLDKQPEVGENITNTKREIEETVDTINDAFENLLDSLFQDVAWDISSDISVMKTMMEQDGLTKQKEGFTENTEE